MSRILGLLVLLSFPQAAGALDFDCPGAIRTKQSLTQKAAGWEVFTDTVNARYSLEGVRFYDGRPEQLANLKPDNGDSDGDFSVWSFVGTGSVWQACVYGATSVMLTRPLPKGIKTCKVTYPPKRIMKETDLAVKARVVCQ